MNKITDITPSQSLLEFFNLLRDLDNDKNIVDRNQYKLENLFKAYREFDISIDLTSDLYIKEQMDEYEEIRLKLINQFSLLDKIFEKK